LGYLWFPTAFLDFDTGRYGMQPRHCCQGRQTDRRRMTQKRPHSGSFPMAKPRNRISGIRKPSKRDKRPQLFCEGSQAQPRRRGKARRTGSQLVAGDLQPTNQAAADGDGSCAKNGLEHSRSSAGGASSAVKRGCSPGLSRGHPGIRVPVQIRPDVGAALCRKPGRQTARVGAPSKQNEGPDQQAHSEGPKPQGAG
jgi:hypothetical protein